MPVVPRSALVVVVVLDGWSEELRVALLGEEVVPVPVLEADCPEVLDEPELLAAPPPVWAKATELHNPTVAARTRVADFILNDPSV